MQGKILAHVLVFAEPESLVLETVAEQGPAIVKHLDRYLVRERVTISDRTSDWAEWFLSGPRAPQILQKLCGDAVPRQAWISSQAVIAGHAVSLRRVDIVGPIGFLIVGSRAAAAAVGDALVAAGATPVGSAAFEAARIEAGFPLYGRDITERNLPQEVARDDRTISFRKGCYLGQETVARNRCAGPRELATRRFAVFQPRVRDARAGACSRRGQRGPRDECRLFSAPAMHGCPGLCAARSSRRRVRGSTHRKGVAEVVSLPAANPSTVPSCLFTRSDLMRRKPWGSWMLLAITVICLAASLALAADPAAETALSRIAFGSCTRQDQPQPIWDAIVAADPQLMILLGDNIYADTDDMDVLRAKYQLLADQPGFRQLKQTCPLLATWDDHDYGANDVGAEYPKKAESQQVFLDFFARRPTIPAALGRASISARTFGPSGKRVQVILLDLRNVRSPLKHDYPAGEPGEGLEGPYGANRDADATLLGPAQWKWLEEQLRQPADLRLIGSSVQVVSHEHGYEAWANFPDERERLLRLIRETKAGGVVFLSGDRHEADISRLPADDPAGVGYPLFDVTSSSLNQRSGTLTKAKVLFRNEINSYRVGTIYYEENFGLIDIDWKPSDPIVRLQVRDIQGNVVLQQRVTLHQLDAPQSLQR